MADDKSLGLRDGFIIALANQRFKSDKTPVDPDGKRPILCHTECPLRILKL
jgi:hypothetical protein